MFNTYDTPNNGADPVALAWLRLLAAMVKRAEKDARRGDQDAARWLAEVRGERACPVPLAPAVTSAGDSLCSGYCAKLVEGDV